MGAGARAATGAVWASVGAGVALRVAAARTGAGAAVALRWGVGSATSGRLRAAGVALRVASSLLGAARRVRLGVLRAAVARASGARRLAGLVGAGGRGLGADPPGRSKSKKPPGEPGGLC